MLWFVFTFLNLHLKFKERSGLIVCPALLSLNKGSILRNRIFALIIMAFAYLPQANASLDGIYKGCGLGHWVANGYANGWLAVTTNVTWDLGTTASISHYSTPGACAGPFYAAAQFIDRATQSWNKKQCKVTASIWWRC